MTQHFNIRCCKPECLGYVQGMWNTKPIPLWTVFVDHSVPLTCLHTMMHVHLLCAVRMCSLLSSKLHQLKCGQRCAFAWAKKHSAFINVLSVQLYPRKTGFSTNWQKRSDLNKTTFFTNKRIWMKAKTDDECGRLHIVCDGLLRAYSCAGIISVILRQHKPIMHTCAGETV